MTIMTKTALRQMPGHFVDCVAAQNLLAYVLASWNLVRRGEFGGVIFYINMCSFVCGVAVREVWEEWPTKFIFESGNINRRRDDAKLLVTPHSGTVVTRRGWKRLSVKAGVSVAVTLNKEQKIIQQINMLSSGKKVPNTLDHTFSSLRNPAKPSGASATSDKERFDNYKTDQTALRLTATYNRTSDWIEQDEKDNGTSPLHFCARISLPTIGFAGAYWGNIGRAICFHTRRNGNPLSPRSKSKLVSICATPISGF